MDLLIVEDDERTSHVMARLLRKLDFEIEVAATALSALESLTRQPDVVVIDLMLAEGNGLSVLETIREIGLKCQVAVLVGETDARLRKDIEALKPECILEKPLNFDEFGKWLCDLFPER